ncbi:MAG: hypothetical protein JKY19_11620 [Alcanivoracaceae bacterium]|nr:hypothetical protein [Alcanivoracaceae bacterium]
MKNIKHKFDMSIDLQGSIHKIDRANYFETSVEPIKDDGGFDCGGTLGSAGTFGGTLGTFGCFGCCC